MLFFLFKGIMPDLFLFLIKWGVSIHPVHLARINLPAVLSTLFKLIEGCGCLRKQRQSVKRVLLNHETAIVGDLLSICVIQRVSYDAE
jgi:hypothetical protein